jgi:hypothetical protein
LQPSAQNAKLRELTEGESLPLLNNQVARFTVEKQWLKVKSTRSARC